MVKLHSCKICGYPISFDPKKGHSKLRAKNHKNLCESCRQRIVRGDVINEPIISEEEAEKAKTQIATN